jgi:hypothetical protein
MAMQKVVPLFALALAASVVGCAGAELSPADVHGAWRIDAVLCSGCGGPVLSLKGTIIEISTDHVKNPAGEGCKSAPGLDFIKEIDSRRALAGPGKAWPEPVRHAVAARHKIIYGFSTCEGMNHMQLALTDRDSAYYFAEDGVTFELRRAGPAASKQN